ncbi:MarR family winged helix-turn-helix transcriptional regulator [Nocardioides plantarum]|uniref:MarR family winged helix-turn-helix transcriptional regulator n=1 Tax=Nocardioides plantarum TaxID=29299 RepID=A0ABV5KEQ8_9ACTN|nr:MarR family transcriptional regulator [Nocardioides plantarum]
MTTDEPWLSATQQQVWRRWVAVTGELPARLNRELQATSGLSLSDYDVLVALSEAMDSRLRAGDLATALAWERSRLSHHVRRMVGRDLLAREECADDGRGAWVVLTPTGRDAIAQAAPGHARLVRELVFDDLDDADLAVLDRVLGIALDRTRGRE